MSKYKLKAFSLIERYIGKIIKAIPLLDRWLISEIIPPLTFSVSSFIVLCLSFGELLYLIRMVINTNLTWSIAIEILFLKLPGYLTLALPMATLLGCLLAFSQLYNNSEIKALTSLGISCRRILLPAIYIGIVMSFITFSFSNYIAPNSNLKANSVFRRGLGQSSDISYKRDIIYSQFDSEKNLEALFHAEEYKDNVMHNLTLVEYDDGQQNRLILAKEGEWEVEQEQWLLSDGSIFYLDKSQPSSKENFLEYSYNLGYGPVMIAKIPSSSNNMNLNQAYNALKLYKLSGNLKEENRLKVKIQEKFTVPLSCLVFSIIGSTLAIRKAKTRGSGQSIAFGMSIILILIYYTVSFLFSALGVSGTLHPFIAAWSPVVIFLIGSEYLIRQSS